jgi:hypothetical protein
LDKARFKDECKDTSFKCITCLAVTDKQKGLRRRWSIKRNAQNIRSIQVQGEYNELADQRKSELKTITHQLLTKRVKSIMGEEGEWELTSLDEPLDINAVDASKDFPSRSMIEKMMTRRREINGFADDDINDREDDYFQFITPTLMGKINDDMNNMIRRYDLNKLET